MTSTQRTSTRPRKETPRPPVAPARARPVTAHEIQNVPFAKLRPGSANVRQAGRDDDIEQLVASIRAKGLLQPLVVRERDGVYEVTAGNRRLAAIGRLIEAGEWDGPIPVIVREESDDEARDTSLVENVARLPMHQVDQYEAFAGLDLTTPEIAARYGVTEAVVRQRLALGRLHPSIRKAWRERQIDATAAQCFTLCRDQARQADVFRELKSTNRLATHAIRQAFISDRPRTDDARVALVGLEAYRKRGGEVDEDLFSNRGYLNDGALLDRLVAEKLEITCAGLLADGWGWAETAVGPGRSVGTRAKPANEGLPLPAEAKLLKSIEAELVKIERREEQGRKHEDDWRRRDALETQGEEIKNRIAARGFTHAQKAKLGCLVEVGEHGLAITWGLTRDGGTTSGKAPAGPPDQISRDDVKPDPRDPHAIPLALLADVGAVQTEAVALVLREVPEVAVQIAAAALLSTSDNYGRGNSPVRLRPEGLNSRRLAPDPDDDDEADDAALRSSGFAPAMRAIGANPRDAAAALAREIARALDCRNLKFRPVTAEDLGALVGALPAERYHAQVKAALSLEDYFKRAPAAAAIAAIEEMGGRPLHAAKKSALVASAVANAHDCGWLPPAVRHPAYKLARRIGDPHSGLAPAAGAAAPAKGKSKRGRAS